MEMGFIVGNEILVVKNAPLHDPVEYRILNYNVSLRRSESKLIEVELIYESKRSSANIQHVSSHPEDLQPYATRQHQERTIRVAFIGNPNCGKTSLFNAASGAREHVGNYSGVTVDAKTATYKQGGYTFELIDLPGAYSLSCYSPEESFIAEYLTGRNAPDVILNVVDATNLHRNLYMTVQLMETGLPIVVALNMFDELERYKIQLDVPFLGKLLGLPFCPTVGRTGSGLKPLFEHIIKLYENRSEVRRIIDIRYNVDIEAAIAQVSEAVDKVRNNNDNLFRGIRSRYIALKLLEEDKAIQEQLKKQCPKADFLLTAARYAHGNYTKDPAADLQTTITETRYGFVSGALRETMKQATYSGKMDRNQRIDHILTHPLWGLPIFFGLLYLIFQATFTLGRYPMEWIESGVTWLGEQLSQIMPAGALHDLLIDGVLGGVGGVIVFLPNIVLLYLFLSLLEDTGYMARGVFIMDKLMHLVGLHGKSFIPLVMGFGCNVPAVMSTRMIESRNSRMVTMLVLPFMSCSARLPVYLLLAGAFFPQKAGLILFVLYVGGIVLAILSALALKKWCFAYEDTPFVMELPPYRIPTPISVLLHMWSKAKQYLHKMGSIILLGSIAIWALGYFPRNAEEESEQYQQEHSYIGQLGHAIEPIVAPLGYDWKMGVSLLSGAAAKEIVVSTMGVLYAADSEDVAGLGQKLRTATRPDGTPLYDPVVIFSFMVFVLVYFPCIATLVAIGRESGSYKWALFSALYTILLAWCLGLLVTQIGRLIF